MTAYYNEHDPFAAAWLRELIAEGLIAPGDVDERDIQQVQADDLRGYTQCHFFAGIGGWSYALRLASWPDDQPVWSGSCPCQPISSAGQRKGHADQRHLWPAFHRLIAECRPAVVFGEQVAGALGYEWLAGIRADLEDDRYAVGAADLCAAGVGAPHIRQRLWWVADAIGAGRQSQPHVAGGELARNAAGRPGFERIAGVDDPNSRLADTAQLQRTGSGNHGRCNSEGTHEVSEPRNGDAGVSVGLADADKGQRGWVASGEGCEPDRQATGRIKGDGITQRGRIDHGLDDAAGDGRREDGRHVDSPARCGEGARHVAGSGEDHWSRAEWLACSDGRSRRVESGIFPLAHGVRNRVGTLRGAGNAIVPILAAQFVAAYVEARLCVTAPA